MGAHLNTHNVFLQKGRENGAGDALVLHQVLEHYVVNRIGYLHNNIVFSIALQI